ncbi:YARHG domain-containing protein [Ruminococcus sp.]|uniref:YARHG domain-containing protein n=1 Tax=Ruminococcus sp. TaxID=41978 RepID=UPI0025D8A8FB|nr:YARHG domain-containing protein [Ruminococcus sp.]MCI6615785.1 YARHG domain-containing protein [Ruminococcus sp.]
MGAHIKLPDSLKSWKIISRLPDDNGNEIYKVSKKDFDGTVISGMLRYVVIKNDEYNIENTDFINDEASFLKTISQSGDCFNYLDVYVNNNPAKKKIEFFIVTEDLKSLSEIMKSKDFDENKVLDFGIQMSAILERLESRNIYHGNINPDDIFITFDGKYKLGGFSDFESKIDDMSFIAPEIFKKESADFTTDIYSLGLIMYSMSNNGKIPFENDEVGKDDAVKMRFDGKSVTAPKNGSEKLKSVIVIACQPNNDNRWKNAGNIKNALTSIKQEAANSIADETLIVPETTDFEGNVFEEYDYSGFDDTAKSAAEVLPVMGAISDSDNTTTNTATAEENTATDNIENTAPDENEFVEIEEVTEANDNADTTSANFENKTKDLSENEHQSYEPLQEVKVNPNTSAPENTDEFEIDNRVFENYEVQKKAKSFQEQAKEKDYGDFFEDSEPVTKEKPKEDNSSEYDVKNDKELNIFETDEFADEEPIKSSKSKKNAVIITICVIITLAALGFIAYCLISGLGKNNENNFTTSPTEIETTVQSTTEKTTTVPPTTVAPTTVAVDKTVTPVVGYGYSYAKKLLEQEGFTVEIGDYAYSEYWPEGYVIAQSPSGDTTAKSGTVVTLDISLGLIEPETTVAPTEEPVQATKAQQSQSNGSDNSYIFSNSSSAYLSKSDVSALSDNNLTLALNEIYARRGRIFKDSALSSYFNSKSWYTPKYTQEEFDKNVTFNDYEQKNLQLMINEQKKRGLR